MGFCLKILEYIQCLTGGHVCIAVAILLTLACAWVLIFKRASISINEVTFSAFFASVTIKGNKENIQIAHKIWTELVTRKVALPFDEKHDVIVEVYNSWYQVFGEIRRLISEIPAEKIKSNKDVKALVNISIKILNLGLRPHLTKWQARFRHWLSHNQDAFPDLSPQEIQKKFPDYDELVSDLKEINKIMVEFTEKLEELYK